jgi:DNA repair protein RecN (Recombination protein N)
MLQALSIKNYALIETLHVDFNSGFTTITGETGAGKSILLGGLSLILGKRADLSSLRDKEKKCVIEATFNIETYKLQKFFTKEDLDYEPLTIIRREILPSGKSRAFVNDSPVNLSALQKLGDFLIDIHSQNETRQLIDESFQFNVIDALAKNEAELVAYKTLLKTYKGQISNLKDLEEKKALALKEYDYNLFLFNELNDVKLDKINLEDLEAEYETLNNVEVLLERAKEVNDLVNDDQVGLQNSFTQLKQTVSKLAQLSNTYTSVAKRIESIYIEFDDISKELDQLNESLDVDPERLEIINNQLVLINNLFKKHKVNSIEDLISIRTQLDEKVIETDGLEQAILQLNDAIDLNKTTLKETAKTIHQNREKAIPTLQDKLIKILSDLGMPNASFNIKVNLKDQFFNNGTDELQFLFSANKGMDYNDLKKAASGGELSRIMLAIKAIMSQYIKLPTIMFDEIDTGVSGEIAHKMGDIMTKMSINMQVFSITHLPQIASKGKAHFKVYKETVGNTTITNLVPLNKEERVNEIALMLGGNDLQASAIAHAKQLLN